MHLEISWEEESLAGPARDKVMGLLEEGIGLALTCGGGPENGEISLLMVDDKTIHFYNQQFRGVDRPTDVLSFAMQEKGEGELDIIYDDLEEQEEDDSEFLEENLLGDILISVERARAQAQEYGHGLERELVYLAVHGTLHLLGYDHDTEEETREMRNKEEEVMDKMGIHR